jgi:ketosteroid isomerase-like protein
MRTPAPPAAAVVSFIDAINAGDVERLASLMTDDHRLQVLDEAPLDGKAANVDAWHGYATSFPDYVIYPHRLAARGDDVAVLGHTTGSHLGLPDGDEEHLTLIWRARVDGGRLARWQILEDTPRNRQELGLDAV